MGFIGLCIIRWQSYGCVQKDIKEFMEYVDSSVSNTPYGLSHRLIRQWLWGLQGCSKVKSRENILLRIVFLWACVSGWYQRIEYGTRWLLNLTWQICPCCISCSWNWCCHSLQIAELLVYTILCYRHAASAFWSTWSCLPCSSVVIDSVSKAVNRTDKLCHCESSSEDKKAAREQVWSKQKCGFLNLSFLRGAVFLHTETGWLLQWNLQSRSRSKGKEAMG